MYGMYVMRNKHLLTVARFEAPLLTNLSDGKSTSGTPAESKLLLTQNINPSTKIIYPLTVFGIHKGASLAPLWPASHFVQGQT